MVKVVDSGFGDVESPRFCCLSSTVYTQRDEDAGADGSGSSAAANVVKAELDFHIL